MAMVEIIGVHKLCPGRGSNPQRQNSLDATRVFDAVVVLSAFIEFRSRRVFFMLYNISTIACMSDYRRGLFW
jgi:hypothetical protein